MVRFFILMFGILCLIGCSSQTQTIKTYPSEDSGHTITRGNTVSTYNHVEQGKRLYLVGKYSQATKHFIRAITNDHENYEAYYYMGLTQQKQNRFDRSISSFKNALKYAPEDILIHAQITYSMAVSWEKEGMMERAGELYKRALTLNPSHAPAKAGAERIQLQLAKTHKKKKDPKAF
ncbi:MAG: tetratricopeptide repeat protein [Candidatus Zixiibacteriota bacterium]